MDGDVYADKPYLYGPLASSINALWVGDKGTGNGDDHAAAEDEIIQEGGSESGMQLREEKKVPSGAAQRMKHFLTESYRKDWTFEEGREYRCDFFNPYLDFNNLALSLPGNFKLHLMSFWDGQPLRYSLKHRTHDGSVDDLLFVVVISLIPEDQVEEQEKKLEEKKKTIATPGVGTLGLGSRNKDLTGKNGEAGTSGANAGSADFDDGGVD